MMPIFEHLSLRVLPQINIVEPRLHGGRIAGLRAVRPRIAKIGVFLRWPFAAVRASDAHGLAVLQPHRFVLNEDWAWRPGPFHRSYIRVGSDRVDRRS